MLVIGDIEGVLRAASLLDIIGLCCAHNLFHVLQVLQHVIAFRCNSASGFFDDLELSVPIQFVLQFLETVLPCKFNDHHIRP